MVLVTMVIIALVPQPTLPAFPSLAITGTLLGRKNYSGGGRSDAWSARTRSRLHTCMLAT
jgi:hypothetical protein